MSDRKSTLASEEGAAPGSPLRRSTRIANSPAPAAAVGRRRSSAAESSVSTPAKISRSKRTSLSHEITLEARPQTPTRKAAAKTTRGASKSPSAEPEMKEVGTPAKRGRRPSITKVKEDEAATMKPATPSRRRSVRASVSPSKDAAPEAAAAKPRGRRASVTQASLESIVETEAKPDPKKVSRPARTTRRTSVEAVEEPEAKKEERKPTRRSVRGRSASLDVTDEHEPEAKPTPELIPINEEEPQTEETAKIVETVDDKPVEVQTAKGDDAEVIEIVDDPDDAEVAASMVVTETRAPTPSKGQDDAAARIDTPSPRTRQSSGEESDSVFKSPVVRRSPRLSTASPDKKASPQKSPLADGAKADAPVKSPAGAAASPRRSPRLSQSCEDLDLDLKVETSALMSPELSVSPSFGSDAPKDKERPSPNEETVAPGKTLVSESVQAVQETSDASVETVDDVDEKAGEVEDVGIRRSKRLSGSLAVEEKTGEVEDVEIRPSKRLSGSLAVEERTGEVEDVGIRRSKKLSESLAVEEKTGEVEDVEIRRSKRLSGSLAVEEKTGEVEDVEIRRSKRLSESLAVEEKTGEVEDVEIRRSKRLSGSLAVEEKTGEVEEVEIRRSKRLSEILAVEEKTGEVEDVEIRRSKRLSESLAVEEKTGEVEDVGIKRYKRLSDSLAVEEKTGEVEDVGIRRSKRLSESLAVEEKTGEVEDVGIKRSKRLSDSLAVEEKTGEVEDVEIRRSKRLSESLVVEEKTGEVEDVEITRSKRLSEILAVEEKTGEVADVEIRRSKRLSESLAASKGADAQQKRKSGSFSASDAIASVASPRSKSLGTSGTPSTDARRDSILKRTPELVSGSDGSFQLNISIPATNSMDVDDDDDERAHVATLNLSGGSTNSDKENKSGKLNVPKSPMRKRASLSETSTPKLNNSIKMQSFCQPIEVEFATDVVVAAAQVAAKAPTSVDKVAGKGAETSQNVSTIEVDNEDEFGTSPVKAFGRLARDADRTEEELMSSFVDEVIDLDVEGDKAATTAGNKDKSVTEPNTILEKSDKKSAAEEKSLKQDEASAVGEADGGDENADEEEDDPVIKVEGGSKRRKILMDEIISKGLDDLIDEKLMEAATAAAEESDEEDEDYHPTSAFVDDMASEGEEDTPSEDSNQIVDEGESLHSSESDVLDDDDDYENDSFITDGECDELLSGNEYDLADLLACQPEKTKKKKRLRVIRIADSSDDEGVEADAKGRTPVEMAEEVRDVLEQQREEEAVMAGPTRKTPVKKAKEEDALEEDVKAEAKQKKANDEEEEPDNKTAVSIKIDKSIQKDDKVSGGSKIIVLQNIKVSPTKEVQDASVVINEEDNLKSLESMKETLHPIVPRDPKPSFSTPNNSMIESPTRKTRRRTSINIQDQIKIDRYSDVEIGDKITKAVDFFVSSIKEKSGNVSVNVSLDYANSSSAEEGSPRKPRVGLKSEDVEEINTAVEEILETTVGEILHSASPSKKMPTKRRSDALRNAGVQGAFEVEDAQDDAVPTSSKRIKSAKRVKEASEAKATGAKKRYQGAGSSKEDLPGKKNKLNKRLVDIDLVPDAKTAKAKRQRRSIVNKSLESAALAIDSDDSEEEPEARRSPPKKKSKKAKAAIAVLSPAAKATDPEMRIEIEINPRTTKSEMATASVSKNITKKFRNIKPSLQCNFDNDGWSVEEAHSAKPSKRNKDKKVPVKEQIERLKKKILPNDFRNQMIYGSNAKRMDSKDIIKHKQKAGHFKRK